MLRTFALLLCASSACAGTHMAFAHTIPAQLRTRAAVTNLRMAVDQFKLWDGRKVCVYDDPTGIDAAVLDSVKTIGKACIEKKVSPSSASPRNPLPYF